MRKDITIAVEVRTSRGKNEARRMRAAGKIPAVVYGAFQDAVSIAISPKEIAKITRSSSGLNTIFNIAVEGGETTPVMVVDQQVDPIRGRLLHADLKRIDLTKRITVTVPVHTEGEPYGVKVQGGLLEIITRDIEIECLPDDIPESFTVSVADLQIGQSKRASDVGVSGSMKLVSDPQSVIAHIVSLRAEEVVAPVEGAAAAEPEVAKAKGKKEEEAAPAADKDKDKAKKK
ncbi:MAG TPA: 50S ribosomal protein L25 [Candidatus Acidoferrum sp.]|nr:50S ribosomal protein L25 [Candidatus Acidoferrum sp.]